MSIGLASYTLQQRADALKDIVSVVGSFLHFASQDHEDLENFFVNLNDWHYRLTRVASNGKRIIEAGRTDDLVTRSLGIMTDSVLLYLNFVTQPDVSEFNQWVADMNARVMQLEERYEQARKVLI